MPQELTIKNPYKRKSDYIPVRIKIFWKTFVANSLGRPHHQTIIPETPEHPAWILGAQPCNYSIKKLLKENPNRKIHIINMLADSERLITEENHLVKEDKIKIMRIPWNDHATLDLTTGKNQTIIKMIDLQKNIYKEFAKKPIKETFYCHCMAGRARSFVETMAFIYFHPNKELLFDFKNWPKEITKTVPENLQKRLVDNPSFSDIAELIQIRRPRVKTLLEMDGDQAGLLGLMTLSREANNPNIIKNRNEIRCYKDAQNIGLMLETPLDLGFRDPKDRKEQEKNLATVYKAYQKKGINLLTAMIISIYKNVDRDKYKTDFAENFKKLLPSEQARFAILAKKLEEKKCDLTPLKDAIYYANISLKNKQELTAGDQVELLRTFGNDVIEKLPPEKIREKILHGDRVDKYNQKIQLEELIKTVPHNNKFIEKLLNSLMLKKIFSSLFPRSRE